MTAGRDGSKWRAVQAVVYREERDCWLCGRYVDQTLPVTHRDGRTVDHLVQLCHGGRPHDRSWCRLAHRGCNSARSNRLRGLAPEQCACSAGMPCAVLAPAEGYLALDASEL